MSITDSTKSFLQLPWAAKYLNRPGLVTETPASRTEKVTHEDSFFGGTLKTDRTVRNAIVFYTRPSDPTEWIEEVSTLIQVGSGLDGWPGILHGGVIAAIVDEGMGILLALNQRAWRVGFNNEKKTAVTPATPGFGFTADLRITYKKPVKTPGVLMVTARYTKKEERKTWIYAEVWQPNDGAGQESGEGSLCATGEALFVRAKSKI